jgi:hypothetical protein
MEPQAEYQCVHRKLQPDSGSGWQPHRRQLSSLSQPESQLGTTRASSALPVHWQCHTAIVAGSRLRKYYLSLTRSSRPPPHSAEVSKNDNTSAPQRKTAQYLDQYSTVVWNAQALPIHWQYTVQRLELLCCLLGDTARESPRGCPGRRGSQVTRLYVVRSCSDSFILDK